MLLQALQITPTCCLHWNTFSELMFSTTTASGNPPTLSSFLCDLASFLRKADLQKVVLLRACLHSCLNLDPVLRPTNSATHTASLGLLHNISVTKPRGHALGNDQHCARKPSVVLENSLSSLLETHWIGCMFRFWHSKLDLIASALVFWAIWGAPAVVTWPQEAGE